MWHWQFLKMKPNVASRAGRFKVNTQSDVWKMREDQSNTQQGVSMKLVSAIHHAALRVKNLEEAFGRWSHTLGLHGELHNDHAILRCTHEDFGLMLLPSDKPGLEYVAYELAPKLSLEEAKTELQARGLSVESVTIPHRGAGLKLQDPDGNNVVLIERFRQNPSLPSEVQFSSRIPGFHPRKFAHVNYLTANAKQASSWYIEKLGFGLTDWVGDEGCWLHVNSDHHVLAFVEKGYSHIHHVAFELVDWGEMRVALDHLAQNARPVVWGPGRHGVARNLYSYIRMPEEDIFMELFCDLEQLVPDHEPRYYPDDAHTSNTWGILPPRSYFRFDAEAIKSESDQNEAYLERIPTPT
jgi:catechol 2,3-dioxygenase-like lactoylglutathione lyase family enzyme